MTEKPKPLPVRHLDGQWQVLLLSPEKWHDCYSEDDARLISRSIVLRHEILEECGSGPSNASDLEMTAEALARNHIPDLSRWFKLRAAKLRQRTS